MALAVHVVLIFGRVSLDIFQSIFNSPAAGFLFC
jgi:hypothetical protein